MSYWNGATTSIYIYVRCCEGLVLTSLDGIGATKVEKAGKSFIGGRGN